MSTKETTDSKSDQKETAEAENAQEGTTNSESSNKDKLSLAILSPTNNAKIEVYEDALDKIFNDNRIKNVAITGPYGSGKTSIIETYKAKKPHLSLITISLSHFNFDDNKDETLLSQIEGKVLNQLLHQIPQQRISKTQFKIKGHEDINSNILSAFLIITLLLPFIFWTINSHFGAIYSFETIEIQIASLILIGILAFTIYRLKSYISHNGLLRRLKIHEAEIEIFENNSDSLFDKYLNEVIYLFCQSEADGIIFEDLDRFNKPIIFERLREINSLVNKKIVPQKKYTLFSRNSDLKENQEKRPIKFIFLIKDDFFSNDLERTKFFDLIIPVIPIASSFNAGNLLKKQFSQVIENTNEIEEFLDNIAFYIDDLRLIKNIANEFTIYSRRLDYKYVRDGEEIKAHLDVHRLLSLIIYKNIFPKDFSFLQKNKGFLYRVIKFTNDQESLFRNPINSPKEIVQRLIQSLKYAMKENGWDHHIYFDKNSLDQKSIEKDMKEYMSNEEKLRQSAGISVTPHFEPINLEEIISIIQPDNTDEQKIADQIRSSRYLGLVKYLLLNNYLDENYHNYISYFAQNGVSNQDQEFIRAQLEERAQSFTYQLDNPEKVVEQLKLKYFASKNILNYNLLDYLLSRENDDDQKLRTFLNYFFNSIDIFIWDDPVIQPKFLSDAFVYLNHIQEFIIAFKSNNIDLFKILLDTNQKDSLSTFLCALWTLILYSDIQLSQNDIKIPLSDYLSKYSDFLNIPDQLINTLKLTHPENNDINYFNNKLLGSLKNIDVRFKDFSKNSLDIITNRNKQLLLDIFSTGLFEINKNNLSILFTHVLEINDNILFQEQNYTTIRHSGFNSILSYINNNLNGYIETITSISDNFCDNIDDVVYLLEQEELSDELKQKYIDKYKLPFKDLYAINKKLVPYIIKKGKAEFNSTNFVYCLMYNDEDNSAYEDFLSNKNKDDIQISESKENNEDLQTALNA